MAIAHDHAAEWDDYHRKVAVLDAERQQDGLSLEEYLEKYPEMPRSASDWEPIRREIRRLSQAAADFDARVGVTAEENRAVNERLEMLENRLARNVRLAENILARLDGSKSNGWGT
jgi:hypothetical protein